MEEIDAIRACAEALEPLEGSERMRALAYLLDREGARNLSNATYLRARDLRLDESMRAANAA